MGSHKAVGARSSCSPVSCLSNVGDTADTVVDIPLPLAKRLG